jgi:hypothetical protein
MTFCIVFGSILFIGTVLAIHVGYVMGFRDAIEEVNDRIEKFGLSFGYEDNKKRDN